MKFTALNEIDFELPDELIAQEALRSRSKSRLLHLDRNTGRRTHGWVSDLPSFLRPGDLLVVNNSKVFPARIFGRRDPSGGRVECLLLSRFDDGRWDVLIRPGQKMKVGERAIFGDGDAELELQVLEQHYYGRRTVTLQASGSCDLETVIDRIGKTPLPPYIKRPPADSDRERYQTIFAKVRGSIAAPTAGLHFTKELMAELATAGIDKTEITLHVGYGTFEPIRAENVQNHRVAPEWFEVTASAAAKINSALNEGRRVVAVGTTTTRVLESVAKIEGGRLASSSGSTELYIQPGFKFLVVGALVTNFHLPQSSLLVLAATFADRELLLKAYAEAVANRYRFYSYGDAMLIT